MALLVFVKLYNACSTPSSTYTLLNLTNPSTFVRHSAKMRIHTVVGSAVALLSLAVSATAPQLSMCTPGDRIINGHTCIVRCNTGRPGGDYKSAKTGSFEACIQQCAADPVCVTAQYHKDDGFCYFKNKSNNSKAGNNHDVVDCGPKATSTT